jgi:hypothetical protein
VTEIETMPLFGEPEPVEVERPPVVIGVKWTSYSARTHVQCMQCVDIVHARRGIGHVDIRIARFRRVTADGELLLCGEHGRLKREEDEEAGLVRRKDGRS